MKYLMSCLVLFWRHHLNWSNWILWKCFDRKSRLYLSQMSGGKRILGQLDNLTWRSRLRYRYPSWTVFLLQFNHPDNQKYSQWLSHWSIPIGSHTGDSLWSRMITREEMARSYRRMIFLSLYLVFWWKMTYLSSP
jgi:hypothetical protein